MDFDLYGCRLKILEKDEHHIFCQVPCADGETGRMDIWQLFPGIVMSFNDFQARCFLSPALGRAQVLEFNHCLRGRYECQFENSTYAYLGPGEIALSRLDSLQRWSGFPLGEYYGISLLLDFAQGGEALERIWPGMGRNLKKIREKFWEARCYYQCQPRGAAAGCLEGFYQEIPGESRLNFYRLRTLELLEHLGALKVQEQNYHAYLPRQKRQRMQQVRRLLEEDLEGRLRLEDVARAADLGLTALKEQFQAVYGLSPMAFRRQVRMRRAAELLEGSSRKVGEIAGLLGYENASKFSRAFRSSVGESPAAYRSKRREKERLFGAEAAPRSR